MRQLAWWFPLLLLSACSTTGGNGALSSRSAEPSEAIADAEPIAAGPAVPHEKMTELVLLEGLFVRPLPPPEAFRRAKEEVRAGDHDAAAASLLEAVEMGDWEPESLHGEEDFRPLHTHPDYVEAVARLEARIRGFDLAFREELLAMAVEHQRLRHAVGEPIEPAERVRIAASDMQHTARLKALVDAKGWPTISKVGGWAATAAWLIVDHADENPDVQAELLSVMEQAVLDGEATATGFATATDRHLMSAGRPQRYGTLGILNGGTKTLHPRRMEDPSDVDVRRARIGLAPLADFLAGYAKRRGVPNFSVEPMLTSEERAGAEGDGMAQTRD